MKKIIILALCLLLPATTIMAANKVEKKSEVKTLSGMSIIGNDEAPKALHIVPWKSSEISVELDLIRIDDPENAPVDRDLVTQASEGEDQEPLKKEGRRDRLQEAGRVDEVASLPAKEPAAESPAVPTPSPAHSRSSCDRCRVGRR